MLSNIDCTYNNQLQNFPYCQTSQSIKYQTMAFLKLKLNLISDFDLLTYIKFIFIVFVVVKCIDIIICQVRKRKSRMNIQDNSEQRSQTRIDCGLIDIENSSYDLKQSVTSQKQKMKQIGNKKLVQSDIIQRNQKVEPKPIKLNIPLQSNPLKINMDVKASQNAKPFSINKIISKKSIQPIRKTQKNQKIHNNDLLISTRQINQNIRIIQSEIRVY